MAGDVGRPRWHKPVLIFALLLVVGQVIVFVILRARTPTRMTSADAATEVTVEPHARDRLVVILGPGTPSVSVDQIRNVFLGRTTVWPNGTAAHPLNRPDGTIAAKRFYDQILEVNAAAFSAYWRELGTTPATYASAKDIVDNVAATSGGIGYVLESELPETTTGVRLIRMD